MELFMQRMSCYSMQFLSWQLFHLSRNFPSECVYSACLSRWTVLYTKHCMQSTTWACILTWNLIKPFHGLFTMFILTEHSFCLGRTQQINSSLAWYWYLLDMFRNAACKATIQEHCASISTLVYRVSQNSPHIGDYVCQYHVVCAFISGC